MAIDPKKIVDHVIIRNEINSLELDASESKPNDSTAPTQSTNQIGLAHIAIKEQRVKIVDSGAWVIIEADGITLVQ